MTTKNKKIISYIRAIMIQITESWLFPLYQVNSYTDKLSVGLYI